jgi:hypothetical protein
MYKITFDMKSPVCYYEPPVFDAILSYCAYQDRRGLADYHTPVGGEVVEIELPLLKHDLGFYMASYMFSDEIIEGMDSWKKRWANQYDHLVDFGKAKRRIDAGSGKFKQYSIPLVTNSCENAWFYFDGDAGEVERLAGDHLFGFGKKTAIGFGWFSGFEIEESGEADMVWFRPLPVDPGVFVKLMQIQDIHIEPSYGAYKLPRWLPGNQGQIVTPYSR